MTKRILIAILALAVVGAGLFVVSRRRAIRQSAGPQLARAATVEQGTLEVYVTGTGVLEPESQAVLSFGLPGIVGTVNVEVGDRVRAGAVLLELDPDSLDAGLIGAEADLIGAQQQLEQLQEPPTEQQLAQARLAIVEAERALDDAQRRLRNVQNPSLSAAEDRVADAQRARDTAQANLDLLTVSDQATILHTAQNSRDLALSQLEAAQRAYDDCLKVSCAEKDFREAALTAAKNNYQRALDDFLTAQLQYDTSLKNQQATLGDADETLTSAQDNLVVVKAGPSTKEVKLAQAQLDVATANLAAAQQTLADLEAGPDPDDVAAAEARVRAAQARLDQTRLVAPFAGTVTAVEFQVGDTVAPGQAAVVLADLERLHVDTTVDELDIVLVDLGQPVEMTLDALPRALLTGEVARIDLAPTVNTATTEYPVRVELSSAEESARIGMTAAVKILVARKEDALLVPNWVLRFDSNSGDVFVMLQRGGDALERAAITLGLRSDTHSEVLDGLRLGDVIGVEVTPEAPRPGGLFGGG